MPQTKHEEGEVQPTPTQEENDLAAIGQHVHLKEEDGSPPDPHTPVPAPPQADPEAYVEHRKKQTQAEQSARGGYQTRQSTPQQTKAPATPSHPPPLATSSSE